jgi:hypothetical protein
VPKEENLSFSDSNTTTTLVPVRVERSEAALKIPYRRLKNVRLRSLSSSMNLTPDLLLLLGILRWRNGSYHNKYMSRLRIVFLARPNVFFVRIKMCTPCLYIEET